MKSLTVGELKEALKDVPNRSVNVRYAVRGKWEILEDYKDGTSRCRCTSCKNTYRLSKQTIYGFSFCPRCSSYNREYDGYKSNKWIEGFKNPAANVIEREKINTALAEIEKQKKIIIDYEGESDLGVAIRIIKKCLGEVEE